MATHWKLQVSGGYVDSANALETWSFGVRLAGLSVGYSNVGSLPSISVSTDIATGTGTGYTWDRNYTCSVSGNTFVPTDYLINQVKPAMETFASGLFSSKVNITKYSLYPIDTTGDSQKISGSACTAHLIYNSPLAGGQGSSLVPLEVACVASLYTARTNKRGRGRIYLPPLPQTALAATGLWSTTSQSNVLASTATLMAGLKLDQAGPATLRVRPIVTGDPWSEYAVVTKIRSGIVPDRQGRRRRSVAENYTEQNVSY